MKRISYSQYSQWDVCPFKWKLNYIDKLGEYTDSIHTMFGTSMHEVLQTYLTVMYNDTVKMADALPLEKMLLTRMKRNYQQIMERNELVGIEVPINYDLPNDIKFIGYIDVLLYDKLRDRYKIIDIKTSTMGWNKYMKADKNKTDQLLLYKQFYGAQHDIPLDKIDVEYFIVKRKLYEKVDFPQRRVQTFSPANGKPSINKVINNLNQFLEESFINGEYNMEHTYIKRPSKKNCRFCEFNQTEHCDAGVK